MKRRGLAATLLAGLTIAGSGAALAVRAQARDAAPRPSAPGKAGRSRPADGPYRASPAFETAPGTSLRLRDQISVRWNQAPTSAAGAWARFQGDAGTGWQVSWDEATSVPSRILGRGIVAPGAVSDPTAAERHARAFLVRHIDLLAPGAAPTDFVLVSNVLRRGMRVVGFRQTHAGIPVLGGQVSFRFKNDRLFVIGSEALPHVVLPRMLLPHGNAAAPAALAADAARGFARSWLLTDAAAEADAGAVTGPFVLPLVGRTGVLGYRLVNRVDVAARGPVGRFWVYTDAATGAPVAREQRLRFAEGAVLFNVPMRYPAGGRDDYPARAGDFTVAGAGVVSDDEGVVRWEGSGPAEVVVRAVGPLVRVSNQGDGQQPATADLPLPADGTAIWDVSSEDVLDAQLSAFIHARLVKDYSRLHFNPDLEWLDQQLEVRVNIPDQCNAFSDGETINFFQSSPECGNTGQLADVIYHEFGHTLHAHSIIAGVGAFDGAHSEGLADYLAASVTGDPAMGRGFFRTDDPLRHLDPTDYENSWPRDVGEIHFTGLIFAGTMWDLRKLLIEQYGEDAGIALVNRLYYATLERATNIPSTYAEVLAEDDDDGDLSNGTPNVCDINTAFGAHGLRGLTSRVAPLAAEMPGEEGFPVSIEVSGFYPQCPGDGLASARIEWRLRGQSEDEVQQADMSEREPGVWSGAIPAAEAGQVVRYKIAVEFLDGAAGVFPDNRADPEYEFFVGEVEPLYCTNFDTDPFAEGWTHGLTAGPIAGTPDDWTWGPPTSPSASGDPQAAFSGENVLGNDLGGEGDGIYQPDIKNFAQTPIIDTGVFSDIRVQYWRWLSVEDGFFDQATIYGNGRVAWQNLNSEQGDQSSTHHLDGEWRFHDVPVSQFVSAGQIQVKFELDSDGGLEFGGWTIDDFCVVAANGAVCGDGELIGAETCDDGEGNSDSEPDACRSNCQVASCGDGVVDSGEACDDGNVEDGDTCSADCERRTGEGVDCGCEVAPRHRSPRSGSSILLALAALALFGPRLRRRRRQR